MTHAQGGDGRPGAGSSSTGNVTDYRGHGGNAGKSGSNGVVRIRYAGNQKANGGSVATSGGYTYHDFLTSGDFVT